LIALFISIGLKLPSSGSN